MNMSRKKTTPKKKKLFDISFLFFIILIVVIPNLYHKQALDKELEVRFLSLSIFLLFLSVLVIFHKRFKNIKTNFSIIKKPPILLYFAYFMLVTLSIFYAVNKSEAIYDILKTANFFILFLFILLFIVGKEKSKESLVTSFVILGLIISLIGFVQLQKAIEEQGFGLKAAYEVKGNFAHKNIYSQVLFMTLTFSMYGIYLFKDIRKQLSYIAALLNMIIILLLMTRSVWVALFASTVVALVTYFIIRKEIPFKNIKKPLFSIISIVIISFLVLLAFSGFDSDKKVQKHVSQATKLNEGNAKHRIVLWGKTFDLIKNNPVFGVGAGNWRVNILKYDVTKSNKKGLIVPRRTHNDYIEIVSNNGIVGLLIYLSIFVFAFIMAFKIIKKSEDEDDKIFNIILIFGLTGYFIYSFFSFPKERIETQIFINVILAFIFYRYYTYKKGEKTELSTTKLLKPITIIAAIILIFSNICAYERLNAEIKMNKLFGLRNVERIPQDRKLEAMYKLTDEAISPFSKITPFSSPIVAMQGKILYQQQADSAKVIEKFKQALEVLPYHVHTLVDLAKIYGAYGNYNKSLEYLEKALEYAPSNNKIHIYYAYYLRKADKKEEAYAVLRSLNTGLRNKIYKDLVYQFVREKLVDISKQIENNVLRQKIYSDADKKIMLHNHFIESVEQEVEFEKIYLTKTISKIKRKQDTLVSGPGIDSLIKVYKIKL